MNIDAGAEAAGGHGAATRWLLTLIMLAAGAGALAWGQRWVATGSSPAATEPAEWAIDHHPTATALGAVLIVAAVVFNRLHARFHASVRADMLAFGERIDGMSLRARRNDLLAASVLGLFLEVALIRWHGTEFRACAYLKNITLLACFLGLGLGFARARRPIVSFPAAMALLVAQLLVMDVLSLLDADRAIHNPLATEVFWGLGGITKQLQALVFYGFFSALYLSTIAIFIPIGQLTGRLMEPATPIVSYTVNILGSLLGVGLFAGVSYLWLPPSVWFGLAGVLGLWLGRHSRGGLLTGGCALAALLGWLGYEPRGEVRNIYSPYQRLEVKTDIAWLPDGRRVDEGVWLAANKTYYMQGMNLSADFVAKWRNALRAVHDKSLWYALPYQLGPRPESVLIVGAGAGNDVAAAVRNGVRRIDAVEIDPAIRWVGETYHPEFPYQAPGIRAVTNDARAFMKRAPPAQYDMVVFGLLDSHTLLSGMSAIRLDNFVYTLESMQEARRLLRPGGRVCLSFAVGPDSLFSARMYEMLSTAFDHPPRTFGFAGQDTLFEAALNPADAVATPPDVPETTATVAATAERLRPTPATDDWPFPFLPGRTWQDFPRPYVYLIGLLAVLSIVLVLGNSRRDFQFSPHFFFLGGAFLLIETKGITELALVFGTTWVVSSVVIAAILALILLANWIVSVFQPARSHVAYACLAASLLAGYFIPVRALLERGPAVAAIGSSTLLCLPLLFAGVVFATSLKRTALLPSAFASNLLGAILGGLCEYGSMMWGFRSLYLAGLALYALSWLLMPRASRYVDGTAE